MNRLKEIRCSMADFRTRWAVHISFTRIFRHATLRILTRRSKLKRKLKVVVAAVTAPREHSRRSDAGDRLEVVPLDTELDHTFPKYNPNPEDMEMPARHRDAVLEHNADVGLASTATVTAAAWSTIPAR